MELLYLWIEDYKNIYRQGFNFSPLYDFEFTPTKEVDGKVIEGTLIDKMNPTERETKEKFYKDFFKDDTTKNTDYGITNVTAIVGENGAGKSSLAEIIRLIRVEGIFEPSPITGTEAKTEFIFITNDFTYHSSKINLLNYNLTQKKTEVNKGLLEEINALNTSQHSLTVFYSDIIDFNWRSRNDFDLSTNNLLQKSAQRHETDTQHQGIISEINALKRDDIIRQIRLFKNNFLREQIPFNTPRKIKLVFHHRNTSVIHLERKYDNFVLKEKLTDWNNSDLKTNIFLHLLTSLSIIAHNFFAFSIEELNNIISDDFVESCNNILEAYDKSLKIRNSHSDDMNPKRVKEFIHIITNLDLKDFEYNSDSISFNLDSLDNDIFDKLYLSPTSLPIFDHEWINNKNQQIFLSTGELAILKLLARLYESFTHRFKIISKNGENASLHISDVQLNYICLIIDEGELGLHPQWQKQYLKILLETLPKIFPNKQIQLILTSHSPFLVSDLPKENVIFLEKEDTTGLCKVSKLDSMKHTFGANIHTLLTDSFFMKGGLVGEFAQSKIDDVIKLLDKSKLEKEEIEHCEMIISMIGEPIVKTMLRKLLDSKRLQKVDEHDDKIERLEKELRKLRGLVNRKTRK
ncbi:hypothetical protein Fleli_3013 [Bernardetia litoralis DSM 6794]|uniref:ATPase AAA-type core domain-containing protein n=1 Tax=Bernardetia litoralis (strain ATCC 23117 / DSM 6794 / NBRC 15988 / NCIMB 1366 / Fx l1 / Sio-4) TaxID=880071 RepID=I4AN19_BERLS|nr:AAA family ATPase [Bernardetia litoralis]AFM05354.1 hypothetical protein Fleli_3013 [Bernardetia litoralis DSM 6794]